MAEYVVDTSIIMQEFIQERYTEQVRRLFSGLVGEDQLYIPAFCLVECANVLWKHVRFDSMSQGEAETLIDDLLNLPFTVVSIEESLPRALQIGVAHKLAIYDSIYIALAEKYGYPLITADAGQETAAKTVGIIIKPITDF